MTPEWYHSPYETARLLADTLVTKQVRGPSVRDAFLASGNWKLIENGATSESEGFSGRALRAPHGAWPTLVFEGEWGGEWSLVLGKLSFRPQHSSANEAFPTPSTFLVQEPYLIVPQAVASDVGLRMIVQFLAEPTSITMDVRLETIAPLDNVSLALDLSWGEVTLHPKSEGCKPSAQHFSRKESSWFDVIHGEGSVGAVVTDLGEGGYVEREADSWRLVMFDQPLEKGVILVGRFGIIRRASNEDLVSFRKNHEKQLERPTFL